MLLQELKKINGTVTQSELEAVLSDINKSESDIHSSEYQLVINRILKARPGGIATTSTTAPAPVKAPQQQPAKTPGGCESAKPATKPPAPTMTPAELVERQRMAAFTAATAGVQLQTALIEGLTSTGWLDWKPPGRGSKEAGGGMAPEGPAIAGELTSGIENYANQAHQASLDILTIDAQVTYLALGAAE
jgi:hypothetical protein